MTKNLPPAELWPDFTWQGARLRHSSPINIADQLLYRSGASSRDAAIVFHGKRHSYDALRHRVAILASALIRAGVQSSHRIALRMSSCPDFIASWLAIQWIGAVCVQMPPQYRRREIAHILQHSGTSAIMCSAEHLSDVELALESQPKAIDVVAVVSRRCDRGFDSEVVVRGKPSDDRACPAAYPTGPDDPAQITYVANAEGPLKGVVHSPADFLVSAETYARDVLKLTSADICVGAMSPAWAFGLGALLIFPLYVGATTTLVDGPIQLLDAIADSKATVLFALPTIYRMLLRHPGLAAADLRSLRCCTSAAEPLPAEVVDAWRTATGLEILDGFGTTELTHVFISSRPGSVRPGFIGTTVTGYEARIVDENMCELPRGTPGELAVRGPTGARYWRDEKAQRHVVRQGWTLVGDICIQHDDGWFQHVRRSDALVICAGHKISLSEVVRALEEHPDVLRAGVISVPDAIRGAALRAMVTPVDEAETVTLPQRLHAYLQKELATFKCPFDIRILTKDKTSASEHVKSPRA